MLGVCLTIVYRLMKTGELVSFRSSQSRRIVVQSIHDHIARQVAADRDGWRPLNAQPPQDWRQEKRTKGAATSQKQRARIARLQTTDDQQKIQDLQTVDNQQKHQDLQTIDNQQKPQHSKAKSTKARKQEAINKQQEAKNAEKGGSSPAAKAPSGVAAVSAFTHEIVAETQAQRAP
jgi:hypothetical protein